MSNLNRVGGGGEKANLNLAKKVLPEAESEGGRIRTNEPLYVTKLLQ